MKVIQLIDSCMNVKLHSTVTIDTSSGRLYHGSLEKLLDCFDTLVLLDLEVLTFKVTENALWVVVIF